MEKKEKKKVQPMLTCAICGYATPMGAPEYNQKTMDQHINKCEKHPLYQARKEIAVLENKIKKVKTVIRNIKEDVILADMEMNEVMAALEELYDEI